MSALAQAHLSAPRVRPIRHADMHAGEGVSLFTDGLAPVSSDVHAGDNVGLFTNGLAPSASAILSGDNVGLFTNGL